MISENIKKMFLFIDFLYDNIENFKQYDSIVNETVELSRSARLLNPEINYTDKEQLDEAKVKHKANYQIIDKNILQPISDKLSELGIITGADYINFFPDIDKLKKDYSKTDKARVKVKSNKYNILMSEIGKNWDFYRLKEFSFFCAFDRATQHLFDFFSEPKPQPEAVEPLPPLPISINESRTKEVIFETFANMDKKGWQYAFVYEQDYNLFADLLTNFFVSKPYTLPETTLQLKRTCKTKVAKALGEIHKDLSNENKLSTDTDYFKLIRVLSPFEKETEGDLYKALTR